AASFQATVVKTLVRKSLRAGQRLGIRRVVLTGGVAANTAIRQALQAECGERGWELFIPSRALCTDNAAMIAAAGHARLAAGGGPRSARGGGALPPDHERPSRHAARMIRRAVSGARGGGVAVAPPHFR